MLGCGAHNPGVNPCYSTAQMSRPPGFFDDTEMPTAGWWEALWPDPAGVLKAVGIKPGMDVIDLCSGDGWFTLQLAKIARHVCAIEIDPQLLAVTRHRLVESYARNVSLITADAYELRRFVAEPVDFIFMANAFHGVPDQHRLAHVVCGALRSGGEFAVVNWQPRPREQTTVLGKPRGPRTEVRLSVTQTIASVRSSGLELDRRIELPPYHYAAIFRR